MKERLIRWLCWWFGHDWEFGWHGNGNMDRRECRHCHAVNRRLGPPPPPPPPPPAKAR